MITTDIQKLFNEELPATLTKYPEKAKEINAKFQLCITGPGGGDWFVDVSETGPKVEQGNPGTADCTATIAVDDLKKLLENPSTSIGMSLFATGKLKVSGNILLAMKLKDLFQK